MKELMSIETANDVENSDIGRVVGKIMQATDGGEVGTTIAALTAVLSLVVVHHSSYNLESVIELLKYNHTICVDDAKKAAH